MRLESKPLRACSKHTLSANADRILLTKSEMENGESIVDAALKGARARLRPILMTSFAFLLGLLPLWTAVGAGAMARRLIGTVTITGMLFSTAFAIFLIPALFVMIQSLAGRPESGLTNERMVSKPEARETATIDERSDRAASR